MSGEIRCGRRTNVCSVAVSMMQVSFLCRIYCRWWYPLCRDVCLAFCGKRRFTRPCSAIIWLPWLCLHVSLCFDVCLSQVGLFLFSLCDSVISELPLLQSCDYACAYMSVKIHCYSVIAAVTDAAFYFDCICDFFNLYFVSFVCGLESWPSFACVHHFVYLFFVLTLEKEGWWTGFWDSQICEAYEDIRGGCHSRPTDEDSCGLCDWLIVSEQLRISCVIDVYMTFELCKSLISRQLSLLVMLVSPWIS